MTVTGNRKGAFRSTAVDVVEDNTTYQALVMKTVDWTGAITGTALWTPASGKTFVMTDYVVSASAACVVTLYRGDTDNTTSRVAKWYFAQYGGDSKLPRKPVEGASADQVLRITASEAGGSITVWGYEYIKP